MDAPKKKRRIPPLVAITAAVLVVAIWFIGRKAVIEPAAKDLKPSRRPIASMKISPHVPAPDLAADMAAGPGAAPAEKAAPKAAAPKKDPKEAAAKEAAKDAGAPDAKDAKKDEPASGGGDNAETVAMLKALLEKVKEEPKDAFTEDPVDYAVAGPDGGVPIHPEGAWKSPYAHPHYGTPANVRVGMLLANVREYDVQKGTFEADFFITLTSDKRMPPVDLIFTNGKMDNKEVMADKPTFKMYRFLGTFSSPADLHDYPFDVQSLTIEVEDDDNGIDQIRLMPDEEHTNLDINFEVPGWETAYTEARVNTHNFPDRFDHDDLYYTRYQFVLGLRRYGTSAVFTVFVPAFVIVLISMTGLWITRDELEVRTNSTTPMLAAAVLFHYSLIQSLPATAYLTRADKLMLAVYVILGIHMLGSLLFFFFEDEHEQKIFLWARRIGIPITFIILAMGVLL